MQDDFSGLTGMGKASAEILCPILGRRFLRNI